MSGLECRDTPSGAFFTVHLKPRARREGLEGVEEGMLTAAVHAPPVEGEANRSLIRIVARALDVPASSVSLVRGEKGRRKSLVVSGMSAQALRRKIHDLGLE
jgi:hypothetical protein